MLDRHLLRSIVLQTLFEWDARDDKKKFEIGEILANNMKEFAQIDNIPTFAQNIIDNVLEKQSDLDNVIKKAAPQWPIEKISIVDRNILRMGISELLFSNRDEVPPKVAINEAIELAKAFGGENSGKFISGVMGTIYKELGEPQKHETSASRKKAISTKDLPTHILRGVLVYSKKPDDTMVIMLTHNIFGYWSLLKGKTEEGISADESIVKKAKRKTGLDIILKDQIGENEYVAFNTEDGHIKKKIVYFLAESDFKDIIKDDSEKKSKGIDDIRWFSFPEIEKIELYEDMKPIIEKGIGIIKKI